MFPGWIWHRRCRSAWGPAAAGAVLHAFRRKLFPSDGTYSDEERGSIYEIAHALADALEEKGAETEVSDELHHPHDAGAYRRSRQTAVQLLKSGPDAIFDIHRDGIKDPDEYAVTIGSKEASKIRILVGAAIRTWRAARTLPPW